MLRSHALPRSWNNNGRPTRKLSAAHKEDEEGDEQGAMCRDRLCGIGYLWNSGSQAYCLAALEATMLEHSRLSTTILTRFQDKVGTTTVGPPGHSAQLKEDDEGGEHGGMCRGRRMVDEGSKEECAEVGTVEKVTCGTRAAKLSLAALEATMHEHSCLYCYSSSSYPTAYHVFLPTSPLTNFPVVSHTLLPAVIPAALERGFDMKVSTPERFSAAASGSQKPDAATWHSPNLHWRAYHRQVRLLGIPCTWPWAEWLPERGVGISTKGVDRHLSLNL